MEVKNEPTIVVQHNELVCDRTSSNDNNMVVIAEKAATEESSETAEESSHVTTCSGAAVSIVNHSIIPLKELPKLDLAGGRMSKEFIVQQALNLEITSIDVTSHGYYLLVGCGNGFILLYNLTQPDHEGLLVGHIQAKGLHTNLLMTLKITEDCRYCFAGVMRGSSEMLAIDLGRLPVWSDKEASKKSGRSLLDLITKHSFSDPKLRGFGAATRVTCADDSFSAVPTYRLVCGRGIKNVHVWQFIPASANFDGAPSGKGEAAVWTCIYDVASNGNTIESVGFRRGGMEVLSKSNGANLRVWDISQYEKDSSAKPLYEDVPNSNDAKTILDEFAFGGTYDFSVVSLKAPKNANRDSFEMPERSTEDTNGQRKKRMMRQIDEIIGTSDARHVLALCTDGGVLYFKNGAYSTDDGCNLTSLTEFSHLQRDPEVDSEWMLKRIGRHGDVLLVRANNGSTSNNSTTYTSIQVDLLVDATRREVAATDDAAEGAWSKIGYYFDPSDPPLLPKQQLVFEAPPQKAEKAPPSRPPLPSAAIKKVKSKPSVTPGGKENNRNAHNVPAPGSARQAVVKPPPSVTKTPHAVSGSSSAAAHISPQDAIMRLVNQTGSAVKKERPAQQEREPQWLVIDEEPPLPRQTMVIDRPLKRLKSASSSEVIWRGAAETRPDRFAQMRDEWVRRMRAPVKRDLLHVRFSGVTGLQLLGQIYLEQDRLRNQFVCDVVRCLGAEVMRLRAAPITDRGDAVDASGLKQLIERYRGEAKALVQRQALDVQGACALDDIFEGRGGADGHCAEGLRCWGGAPLPFKYEGMFAESLAFCQQVAAAAL